jgi:hypothetical protein
MAMKLRSYTMSENRISYAHLYMPLFLVFERSISKRDGKFSDFHLTITSFALDVS